MPAYVIQHKDGRTFGIDSLTDLTRKKVGPNGETYAELGFELAPQLQDGQPAPAQAVEKAEAAADKK